MGLKKIGPKILVFAAVCLSFHFIHPIVMSNYTSKKIKKQEAQAEKYLNSSEKK